MQTSQPLSFKLILLETSEYVTTRNDNSLLLLFFSVLFPFSANPTRHSDLQLFCLLLSVSLNLFSGFVFLLCFSYFFNHYCCFCCVFNLLLLFFLSYLSRKLSLDHANNNNDSSHVKKVITLTQSQNFFFSYIS